MTSDTHTHSLFDDDVGAGSATVAVENDLVLRATAADDVQILTDVTSLGDDVIQLLSGVKTSKH